MDTIYLPFLTHDDLIRTALDRMKAMDTHAVVVSFDAGNCLLYKNHHIVHAWQKHIEYCKDLNPSDGESVSLLIKPLAATDGSYLYDILEKSLDEESVRLGIPLPPNPDIKITAVVTRHETITEDLRSTNIICVCNGDERHEGNHPPAEDGRECDYCKGTYECF